jgi:hypothetical protein
MGVQCSALLILQAHIIGCEVSWDLGVHPPCGPDNLVFLLGDLDCEHLGNGGLVRY